MEQSRDGSLVVLWQVFAFIIVLTLLLMILSFPAGLYAVFGTKLSNSTSVNTPLREIVLLVAMTPIVVPVHATIGGAFLAFSLIYAVFFVIAALQKVNILTAIRDLSSLDASTMFQNPLLATIVGLGALTFGLTILDVIQTSSGIPTGQITGDPLYLFLGITMAPLTEEFGFRFVLIGVPLFLILVFSRSSLRRATKSLWRPSAAWEESATGGGLGTRRHSVEKFFTYVLVAVSSVLFGLAHYLANSGWDVGKVSEAAIAGVALGYLYTRYGFHTNVLLHWGVNFFGTAYAFLGQGLWNIPWTSDTGSMLTLAVEVVLLVALGLPSFILVTYNFLKRVVKGADAVA